MDVSLQPTYGVFRANDLTTMQATQARQRH
jgi:hypothetical protein